MKKTFTNENKDSLTAEKQKSMCVLDDILV